MDAQGLQQLLEDNREKITYAINQAEHTRRYMEIQHRGAECARTYRRIIKAFQAFTNYVGESEHLGPTRTFDITLEQGDYVDFGKGFITAQVVGVNPPYEETPLKQARGFAVEYFFVENVTDQPTASVLLGSEIFQAFDTSDDGLTEDSLVFAPSEMWNEAAVLESEAKVGAMMALAYQTLSLLTDRANDHTLNSYLELCIDKEYLEPLRPSE